MNISHGLRRTLHRKTLRARSLVRFRRRESTSLKPDFDCPAALRDRVAEYRVDSSSSSSSSSGSDEEEEAGGGDEREASLLSRHLSHTSGPSGRGAGRVSRAAAAARHRAPHPVSLRQSPP